MSVGEVVGTRGDMQEGRDVENVEGFIRFKRERRLGDVFDKEERWSMGKGLKGTTD